MQGFPTIRDFRKFPRLRSRGGAALLLVLGFVVLLSFLTIGILKNAQREILWQAEGYARPQLEIAARSTLETALAVIANFQNIDNAIYAPQQGWGDALSLAGFEYIPEEKAWRFDEKTLVSVEFKDESGRYPLNTLLNSELASLLVAVGISTSDTDALCDCFFDWTDADDNTRANGAEIDEYESENAVVVPPNRQLNDLRELRYIRHFREMFFDEDGNPNGFFRRLEGAVSLHASSGKPNINTAPADTLSVLCYDTDANENSVLEYLNPENAINDSPRIFRNANDLSRVGAEALSNKVTFVVRTLRITVTARRGNASYVLNTLVEIAGTRGGSNSTPFTILEQKENILEE